MDVVLEFLFEDKWSKITGDSQKNLVQFTADKDIRTPHACLEGGCGSCKCSLLDGKVEIVPHDALSQEEIAKGIILACQAKPKSNFIKISYDLE
jgi:3-ketosteroid 9alpha-monooxygenase subunit B